MLFRYERSKIHRECFVLPPLGTWCSPHESTGLEPQAEEVMHPITITFTQPPQAVLPRNGLVVGFLPLPLTKQIPTLDPQLLPLQPPRSRRFNHFNEASIKCQWEQRRQTVEVKGVNMARNCLILCRAQQKFASADCPGQLKQRTQHGRHREHRTMNSHQTTTKPKPPTAPSGAPHECARF